MMMMPSWLCRHGYGHGSKSTLRVKNYKNATLEGRVVGLSGAKHDWTSELKSRMLEKSDALIGDKILVLV